MSALLLDIVKVGTCESAEGTCTQSDLYVQEPKNELLKFFQTFQSGIDEKIKRGLLS